MKSHTDNQSEGYQAVCDALATMTALAAHINDMKRRHEHAVRVQEIQSLLYGWEVSDMFTNIFSIRDAHYQPRTHVNIAVVAV